MKTAIAIAIAIVRAGRSFSEASKVSGVPVDEIINECEKQQRE